MTFRVGPLLDEASRRLTAAGRSTPRLDAEVLLAYTLGRTRTHLYIHPETEVPPVQAERYESLLQRRSEGEPVAYLRGVRDFMSLEFEVTPACLIPRAETETLVEAGLARLAGLAGPLAVADIGTGSGAIAVALAHHQPRAWVQATDTSPAALAVAARNATRHGVGDRVECRLGSLLEPVTGPLHLVLSNPPYVSETDYADLAVGVRDYEPKSALVAGPTGLECYPELARQAFERLRPGGWLLVEMAPWQEDEVITCLQSAGLVDCLSLKDLSGRARVAGGQRPGEK